MVDSDFARERRPAWTANLITNPDAGIVIRGDRMPVRARLLEGAKRGRRRQTAVAWFPDWTLDVAVIEASSACSNSSP